MAHGGLTPRPPLPQTCSTHDVSQAGEGEDPIVNATAIYIAAKITGLFPLPPAVLFTAKGGGARASCARAGEVVVAVTYRIWSHPSSRSALTPVGRLCYHSCERLAGHWSQAAQRGRIAERGVRRARDRGHHSNPDNTCAHSPDGGCRY